MPSWLNYVAIAAPRNGTTSHTVSPASGTVVTGSLFTPASGNLLVATGNGGVTFTTPSGWTLPTNGAQVNTGGLYLFTKTAAGSDTLTTTHNGSNYPALFNFFEFAAGSTFLGCAGATGKTSGSAGPSLTGLTGTHSDFGVTSADQPESSGTKAYTWSSGTELIDTLVLASGTDGYSFSLAYTDGATGSSASFTPSWSGTANAWNNEELTFSVNVAAGAPAIPPLLIMQTRRAF